MTTKRESELDVCALRMTITNLIGINFGNSTAQCMCHQEFRCCALSVSPPRFDVLIPKSNYVQHIVRLCILRIPSARKGKKEPYVVYQNERDELKSRIVSRYA